MKKIISKLVVIVLLISLLTISLLTKTSSEINTNSFLATTAIPDTQFIIGAFDDGAGSQYSHIRNELKFNVWHSYPKIESGWDGDTNDRYNGDTNDYKDQVTSRISNNGANYMRTFMDRPIIQYVVSGQRIDYQCENVQNGAPFGFWAYNNSLNNSNTVYDMVDNSIYGSNDTVKYCKADSNHSGINACWIDSSLRANRELSFTGTNSWLTDDAWDWYVMPRIRIDSSYAASATHDTETVCRLIIFGWYGDTVKNINLRIENFKNSGIYSGNYIDKFYYLQGQDSLFILKDKITRYFIPKNPSAELNWDSTCQMDIKIYWAGKVDTWFDRMRLENEPAHLYMTLNDQRHQELVSKVNSEIFWAHTSLSDQKPNYFYFEECQFSHFSAIKELNKQIMNVTQNANSQIIFLNYQLFKAHVPNSNSVEWDANTLKYYLHDQFGLKTIVMGAYPLMGFNETTLGRYSYHPNTLSSLDYNDMDILSIRKSPTEYDNWLQNNLDNGLNNRVLKSMDALSKDNSDMHIFFAPQAHLCRHSTAHLLKEPSNEELELQTYLALTYNAKGIMYFAYTSFGDTNSDSYQRGIMNTIGQTPQPRHVSAYGQDKYEAIKQISIKLNKWGPTLMSFNPEYTKSYIYRLESERTQFFQHPYFRNVYTLKYGSGGQLNCDQDNFLPELSGECPEDTYIQIATFNNNAPSSQYFMIINKRCAKDTIVGTDSTLTGKRFVRVLFKANSSSFSGFNNWKIIDLYNDSLICTFDKRISAPLSLGKYKPGEGKLYKMIPVMVDGGTLVCDEAPTAGSFICDNAVFNDGYNITLYPSTTISFNPNGKIVMNGGNFITGSYASNQSSPPRVTLHGNGNRWEGLSLTNCGIIEIGTTNFSDIYDNVSSEQYQNTAINIINCYNFAVSGCSFNLSNEASAIDVLINGDGTVEWSNAYFGYNNFVFSSNSMCPIKVNSPASSLIPMYICNNSLINNEESISMAMSIYGVIGGTIRNNVITNFINPIFVTSSTLDLFDNYIYSNIDSNNGVYGTAGSHINMSSNIGYYTGGSNHIITANSTCCNINVDNSFFDISAGNNLFNISSSSSSYHLFGTFPEFGDKQRANNNCYQIDTANTQPVYEVYWETSDPVEFDFGTSVCGDNPSLDYDVFTFSNAFNDTVYKTGSGSGGGEKEFNNMEITTENNYAKLCDSLNVNVRKRNYPVVEAQCKYLLTNYPDSIRTLAAISWLYYSTVSRDSLSSKMNALKSFYETLILNNSENEALIDRAFYFIQKCKVALKQYQDAMTGFQLIMTQHPYSFEGLVASWDYAATHLLDSLGGYGGGENNLQSLIYNVQSKDGDNLEDLEFYLNSFMSNYDSTKFNKSDRVKISDNTKKSFEKKKKRDIEIINDLNKRSEKGDKTAARELQTKKAINEVVKVKKPKTQIELKKIISNDVNKIFVKDKKKKDNAVNQIPKEFSLYQNYPNPFNPVTKISFDLPKDAKIKLIVYDILGREVTRLLNSEFLQTGKHIINFDAMKYNLASGVYFYRIESEDFNAVKKMVLIK
ncbi:MAG TPA: T9SS type A sorting domain-containing protein [Ignavibacteria bacterium]